MLPPRYSLVVRFSGILQCSTSTWMGAIGRSPTGIEWCNGWRRHTPALAAGLPLSILRLLSRAVLLFNRATRLCDRLQSKRFHMTIDWHLPCSPLQTVGPGSAMPRTSLLRDNPQALIRLPPNLVYVTSPLLCCLGLLSGSQIPPAVVVKMIVACHIACHHMVVFLPT